MRGVHTFPKGICPKVNVIVRLEYKLTYYDSAVRRFNHCATRTDSQTPCLPWISYATQKLMLDSWMMVEKQSKAFHTFLWHFCPSLKHNFIAYRSSKVSSRPDIIFEIYQLWQSGFSRMYSNCCCRCSFQPEIIEIGQSSHKMYSNNILNFQESMTILNSCTKKVWKLIEGTT